MCNKPFLQQHRTKKQKNTA